MGEEGKVRGCGEKGECEVRARVGGNWAREGGLGVVWRERRIFP